MNLDNSNLVEEEKIFDFSAFVDILKRRKNLMIFSSSLLFSIFSINTLYNFFRNPIYQGSFSILIADPIDNNSPRASTIEERLAINNTISELPTLIEYLKSEHVLRPVADQLGINLGNIQRKLNIVLDGKLPYVARGILKVSLQGRKKILTQIGLEKLSLRFVEAANEQRQLRLRSGLEFLDSEFPLINEKTIKLKSKIENFRKKYNIVDPLIQARSSEQVKSDLIFDINNMKSNITKLNSIKADIDSQKIEIEGYNQAFLELGIKLTGYDQELLSKYKELQSQLAVAKTNFKKDSLVVKNLVGRINNLYPEIKQQQLKSIELAIKSNDRKIKINESRLNEIERDFQLQPELLNEYEELQRQLTLSIENLNSLINAKESFQLQIAQKSLPWRIIDKPVVASFPISPNLIQETIRNLLLAIFTGLILVFIKESIEKGFTSETQIEKMLKMVGIPLIGSVPFIKSISEANELDKKEENSDDQEELSANQFLCSESFRSIATSIRFLKTNNKKLNTLIITSTKPSEGKTTITSMIATTFADLGNKVLLVDADMRKPSIHTFFDIDNISGLSNLITDSSIQPEKVILKSNVKGLDILTAGILPPDPVYLLSSERMDDLFKQMSGLSYDYLIFDAPPSEGLADAKVLYRFCDLCLFIITLNKVEKDSAKKVINYFPKISKGKTGVIINYLKEKSNFLNNYSYKYNYNSDIYKYYRKNSGSEISSNEKENEKVYFSFKSLKDKLLKDLIRFKEWIDF